jgi:hypothetical protein
MYRRVERPNHADVESLLKPYTIGRRSRIRIVRCPSLSQSPNLNPRNPNLRSLNLSLLLRIPNVLLLDLVCKHPQPIFPFHFSTSSLTQPGPTISYKYCYITTSTPASASATYGIDPKSIARGSSICAKQYKGAKPTPVFDEYGKPRCCGPIKEYNFGEVVGQCP